MKILITGANGFIGKHLTPRLLKEGHVVTLFLHNSSTPEESRIKYEKVIKGNLSSGEGLDQVKWESIDAIIHLACAGVKSSQRVWEHCINTNINGTENLINSITNLEHPPLLVYPRTFYENYLDQFPVLKNNPYMSTKKETTIRIERWSEDNHNSRVCLPKIFQAYGPSDDSQNVLTYTINQLKTNQNAELSSGDGLRD
jgi:nucleoside-diphosphate-sugar epimerase